MNSYWNYELSSQQLVSIRWQLLYPGQQERCEQLVYKCERNTKRFEYPFDRQSGAIEPFQYRLQVLERGRNGEDIEYRTSWDQWAV